MNRERHLRNYDLHSWSGIALGLIVYVVVFTGCFALFRFELQPWEDPAKRLPFVENPIEINAPFTHWVEENAFGQPVDFARITYPTPLAPYFTGGMTVPMPTEGEIRDGDAPHGFITQRWDPKTGDRLPARGAGLVEWLLDFHRDLMWPQGLGGRTVGRTLVGVVGIILMLSILSGVIAHTKIFQELFTLRYFRSVRLKWQDTHKVVGLWGLPFFAMISFTGAVLGVVAILAPIVALLTFKGDQEALFAAVIGAPVEAVGIEAPMLSVDKLAELREPNSGKPVSFIVMNNWRDQNARFDIYFPTDTELPLYEGYQIDGVTGERIVDSQFENLTLANAFVNAVSPLHYGNFGGKGLGSFALKSVYFLLGLALAVITAFGLMMWVERRLHGNVGKRSEPIYRAIGHLTAGVCMGLPLATAAIFYLDKLYFGVEASRLYWTGVTYFVVWGAGLAYAFYRRNDYLVTRELLLLSGILFAGLPFLNAFATGTSLLTIFTAGNRVAQYVDIVLMLSGLATLWVALLLPKQRSEKAPAKIDPTKTSTARVLTPAE
ncbi:MAG: PepSY-associated TM helix domain-containing protein [Pseudomonadota bacterium]